MFGTLQAKKYLGQAAKMLIWYSDYCILCQQYEDQPSRQAVHEL